MKNTLFAATAISLLMSANAYAADAIIYQDTTPYAPAAAQFNWSGFYLGINGGYVWTRASVAGASEQFNGGALGAHAGYNHQIGDWVVGGEIDIARTWNENSYFAGDVLVGTDWQGSLRARVGYALDRTLVYATGGVAVTNAYINIPAAPLKLEDRRTGWTIGAGLEHAFTDNWIARAEYRYSDYGNFHVLGNDTGIAITEHTIRAGISYKF